MTSHISHTRHLSAKPHFTSPPTILPAVVVCLQGLPPTTTAIGQIRLLRHLSLGILTRTAFRLFSLKHLN
jgi:hypothetical protein